MTFARVAIGAAILAILAIMMGQAMIASAPLIIKGLMVVLTLAAMFYTAKAVEQDRIECFGS